MGRVKARSGEKRVFRHRWALAALVPILLLLLSATACSSVPSAPDLPEIELPTIARNTTPSPVPTVVAPNATPIPKPSPTPSMLPYSTLAADAVLVPTLQIAEIPTDLPTYSRDDWKHWVDVDKDCQDTRVEVLIEESLVPPTFKNEDRCRVISGLWEGPYTGQSFTEASDLDIDHLVPLKNAHLSGGWQWDEERKEDYANSMATDYHLIAVENNANRSKGARGPEEWKPPDQSYHCQYARDWVAVKAAWDLTATAAQWEALEAMLGTCPYTVGIGDGGGTIAPETPPTLAAPLTNTPSPTAAPSPETFSGSLVITELMPDPSAVRDATGEWFEVHNPDEEQVVNLLGWTIRKDGGDDHRISQELAVPPGGYVVLARNGDETANGEIGADYEYGSFTLTNDGDVIELVEPGGRVVDRVEYSEDLVFAGASTTLGADFLDAAANDDLASWCRATTAMPNGDFGTPGGENDACQ